MTTLHIQSAQITINASPGMDGALFKTWDSDGKALSSELQRPAIGEYWPGQGGIYAGDFRGDDGVVYGLILSPDEDIGRASWGPSGERTLSDWDGLANTSTLVNDCPAAKLAASIVSDGHTDFYLPARRELQFAGANLQHLFGKESWYWTSTPYSSDYAWAVGFEGGHARFNDRFNEFRVRPVRRFIY